jgi:hypothetical protein
MIVKQMRLGYAQPIFSKLSDVDGVIILINEVSGGNNNRKGEVV